MANDHNGFVLGRQAFHNTLLNVLYAKQNARDYVILSLDAEKGVNQYQKFQLIIKFLNLLISVDLHPKAVQ